MDDDVFDGEPSVVIRSGELEATFLPGLGMLGASLRHAGAELLVLPHGIQGYRDGHQAGLPLLAPWANRLGARAYRVGDIAVDLDGVTLSTDDNGLPIHGTLTAATGWRVTSAGADRLSAELSFDTPALLAAFPFPHRLAIDATVGNDTLWISTTLTATGDRVVPVSFGWHPYLRLPNGGRSTWALDMPECEHVELDDRGLPTGRALALPASSGPIGGRVFDDLYRLGDDRLLALSDGDLRLEVRFETGCPYAQVFAPPGAEFVCLEPMTATTNALVDGGCPLVAPGSSFTGRFGIGVGVSVERR